MSRRPALAALVAVVLALCLVPAASGAPTIVSLTFDDGTADQTVVPSLLAAHGMHATLYVISGRMGSSSYYMTWPQVHDFAAGGNEIGGHTVDHVDLTTLTTAQQQAEVCDDRANITAQGFPAPVSFAYPYAATNASAEQVVRDCGYLSARNVGLVGCGGCVAAETIPPLDPFDLRTPSGVLSTTSLATIEGYVTKAEGAGGGWVILVFHNVCEVAGCNSNGITRSDLTALLDWLQPRAVNGTVVQTVGEVLTGTPPPPPPPDTAPPTTSATCNGGACTGWYAPGVTVGLVATDSGGSAVAVTCVTTDGTDPAIAGAACTQGTPYAGPFALAASATVRYRSADTVGNIEAVRSQAVAVDGAAPSVAITAPAAGARLPTGRTTITSAASDAQSGVAQVRFLVDGRLLATDTTAPYSATWQTKSKDRGAHTLTAQATDRVGNASTSAPVSVTVG